MTSLGEAGDPKEDEEDEGDEDSNWWGQPATHCW